jgi:YHS domain-containing protein
MRYSHFSAIVTAGAFLLAACRDAPSTSSTTGAAPSASSPAAPSAATSATTTSALSLVEDRSKVCMVNDQYMGKAQIPTAVGGKTYYGCCAMCKEKLEKNDSARTAVDPVSSKPVDKASAVIGRDESGKVFYFQDEANRRLYRAGS